jgi:hypothetical protein
LLCPVVCTHALTDPLHKVDGCDGVLDRLLKEFRDLGVLILELDVGVANFLVSMISRSLAGNGIVSCVGLVRGIRHFVELKLYVFGKVFALVESGEVHDFGIEFWDLGVLILELDVGVAKFLVSMISRSLASNGIVSCVGLVRGTCHFDE